MPKEHFQEELLQCVSIPVPIHLAMRHGWLWREKRKGGWHKRYFLLFRHTLVWYKTDKPDELAQGALTLADSNVVRNKAGGHDIIELMSPLALLMRSHKETSRGRVFKLRAADSAELEGWCSLFVQQNTHTEGTAAWPQEYEQDKGWIL